MTVAISPEGFETIFDLVTPHQQHLFTIKDQRIFENKDIPEILMNRYKEAAATLILQANEPLIKQLTRDIENERNSRMYEIPRL